MDVILFRYLNGLAGYGALPDGIIIFFASNLQYVLGAVLLVYAFWPRYRRMAIVAFGSAIIARLTLKPLILFFVHRPRPFIVLDGVHNLVGTDIGENLSSFPSGHAVFFFALATAVYRYDRRLGWWFFAGATLMSIARIAGGIHWPGDILGGAFIGTVSSWLLLSLYDRLRHQS